MKNGDRFTGEVKGLQHGELIFKRLHDRPSSPGLERVDTGEQGYLYRRLSSGARAREPLGGWRTAGDPVGIFRELRRLTIGVNRPK